MQQNIEINGPKTVTLSPQTIGLALKALYTLPFGEVVNAINEIQNQLIAPPAEKAVADAGKTE